MRKALYVGFPALVMVCAPVHGQMSAPPITSALPHVNTMTAANSAGVLEYCVRQKLVSTVSADSIVERLAHKHDIKSSPDYLAGQSGQVLTKGGSPFVFARAASYLQSQVCDMVLDHAKQF